MNFRILATLAGAVLAMYATQASADIVTFNFNGTITYDLNSTYTAGQAIPVSISIDYGVAGTPVVPGVTKYVGAVTALSIGSFSITPDFATHISVANDYFDGTQYVDAIQVRAQYSEGPTLKNMYLEFLSYASAPSPILTSLNLPMLNAAAFPIAEFGYSYFDAVSFSLRENVYGESLQNVAPVPEPSTWAMMILGFTGVGFIAYRRRKTASLAA